MVNIDVPAGVAPSLDTQLRKLCNLLRLCTILSRDHATIVHNLEIGTQSKDSENVQHNLKIAQILRLRTTYIHKTHPGQSHSLWYSLLMQVCQLLTGRCTVFRKMCAEG